MKVASIVGARPQFIKLMPLSLRLRKEHNEIIIHTGQHYDYEMSRQFFDELSLPEPDYNLEIGSGTHGEQTGKMLIEIEKVLIKEKPDLVIVFGDTNSTLAGALSSTKLHIPTAHIEAGLRAFNRSIPEEINRVIIDHISDLLFCPTNNAIENLNKEGISKGVFFTGDIMLESFNQSIKIANEKSNILERFKIRPNEYYTATIHRASNTDIEENLKSIISAFIKSEVKIIFPMHPRTKACISKYNLIEKIQNADNVVITEPLGYLDFLKLMKNSSAILTDSGGIQKEAYFLKVPCITLRDETEWIETIQDGWNILTGTDEKKIISAIKNFHPKNEQKNYFGNGKTSEIVVDIINKYLDK